MSVRGGGPVRFVFTRAVTSFLPVAGNVCPYAMTLFFLSRIAAFVALTVRLS
jgi:hypothetical protein